MRSCDVVYSKAKYGSDIPRRGLCVPSSGLRHNSPPHDSVNSAQAECSLAGLGRFDPKDASPSIPHGRLNQIPKLHIHNHGMAETPHKFINRRPEPCNSKTRSRECRHRGIPQGSRSKDAEAAIGKTSAPGSSVTETAVRQAANDAEDALTLQQKLREVVCGWASYFGPALSCMNRKGRKDVVAGVEGTPVRAEMNIARIIPPNPLHSHIERACERWKDCSKKASLGRKGRLRNENTAPDGDKYPREKPRDRAERAHQKTQAKRRGRPPMIRIEATERAIAARNGPSRKDANDSSKAIEIDPAESQREEVRNGRP